MELEFKIYCLVEKFKEIS